MKKYAIFLILTMFPLLANSANVTLSWLPPTTRTDFSALDSKEILGYQIELRCNSRSPTIYDVPSDVSSYTIENVYGNCAFRIKTIDTKGLSSEWSNTVSSLIKLDKPKSGGFK